MATRTKKFPETVDEMRKYEGALYVKNLTPSAVSANSKELQFNLDPGEVKPLPKEALSFAGFIRMWKRGDLAFGGEELESESLDLMARDDAAHESRMAEIMDLTEENSSGKDLVEKECLISKETVFQSQKDIDNLVPPLAERHKNRAHEFSPTQVQLDDGSIVTKFNRVQIG